MKDKLNSVSGIFVNTVAALIIVAAFLVASTDDFHTALEDQRTASVEIPID